MARSRRSHRPILPPPWASRRVVTRCVGGHAGRGKRWPGGSGHRHDGERLDHSIDHRHQLLGWRHFQSGKDEPRRVGRGPNNGLGATSVPLGTAIAPGTKLSTDGLNGGLYPAGFAGRVGEDRDPNSGRGELQPDTQTGRRPSTPVVPRRGALGTGCVRRVLLPATLVTLLLVAIQLSIFSGSARRRRGDDRMALASGDGSCRTDRAVAVVRVGGGCLLRHARHHALWSHRTRGCTSWRTGRRAWP